MTKEMNTEPSKVYFTDFSTSPNKNIFKKLSLLLQRTGMQEIDFNKKFVAIKIHFGEPGNMAYLRPNFARKVVVEIKKLGGKPFLTDSNTLYSGRRSNALDHLDSAYENGFSPFSTGCHVIIADGLNGMDFREIEINGKYCKTAKIGTAIADADVIVSMNHFKGHEQTGFGGALKNLGMGAGAVPGKMEMHSSSIPFIETKNCTGCSLCVRSCRHAAVTLDGNRKAVIDQLVCVGCGQCIAVCQFDAAQPDWSSAPDELCYKIAEYTLAVLKDKLHFHINFIMDVSPDCDCWGYSDVPIVPNIGILASFDPVALDQASVDLVNKAPIMKGSRLSEKVGEHQCDHCEEDRFHTTHPHTDWKYTLQYAEEIGVGKREYELIKI